MNSTSLAAAPQVEFESKAGTLARLFGKLEHATVLPQISFTVDQWLRSGGRWTNFQCNEPWLDGALIVRSSATTEDQPRCSGAGRFLSIGDISNEPDLERAISSVIAAYGDARVDHEVLVQPMLQDASVYGVGLSYSPAERAPYYLLNYDATSGRHDAVTSGSSTDIRTCYVARNARIQPGGWKSRVIKLLKELEGIFSTEELDIEFDASRSGELYLLQVRPLTGVSNPLCSMADHKLALQNAAARFSSAQKAPAPLLGKRAIWGLMADWNPAEIIGVRPRPLSYSLYKYLVTDNSWAEKRFEYGYRDVRGVPLMHSVGGVPYIDVRASFSSLIPRSISDDFAARLVDWYGDELLMQPQWHDKIEARVLSCVESLSPTRPLDSRLLGPVSEAECEALAAAQRQLNRNILDRSDGHWLKDIALVSELPALHAAQLRIEDSRERLRGLLSVCTSHGTLPFAGLARVAFIAAGFLQSMVRDGILSDRERAAVLSAASTISSTVLHDFHTLDESRFMARYGHMRPSMYDILSPRYDDAYQRYFPEASARARPSGPAVNTGFSLSARQHELIQGLLVFHHLDDYTPDEFMALIGHAIRWREQGKFLFSATLSDLLETCKAVGAEHDLSVEDVSYLDVEHLLSSLDVGATGDMLRARRHRFNVTRSLKVPPLVSAPEDFYSFEVPRHYPTYISQQKVVGPVVTLSERSGLSLPEIEGKIVVLEAADPGYDWIFTHRVLGFITLYGGSNSHMAIRAAEHGVPAALGVGESIYQVCVSASVLELDCMAEQIIPVL